MPLFALEVKANLENMARLFPAENNAWKLDVSSDSESRNGVTVCADDVIELEGSRGTANFVVRFPGSKQQSYIKIVPLEKCSWEYRADQSGEFVRIIGFECRGLTIDRWIPTASDFSGETTSGFMFDAVDLTDGDGWTEYDEQAGEAVSVMELEHRIVRV